jgi:GNAT superfamily N-acetyltransferase
MTASASSPFRFRVYDGDAGVDQFDDVRTLYADVYAEPPYCEGPDDVREFAQSWPHRVSRPGFRLVVARVGSESAGFIFGHQLPADTRRWENALEPLPAELTAEWPGRTFLIVELAVRRKFRRRGLGRALHAAVLRERPEERVTLLVRPEPEAAPAQQLYEALGYTSVGPMRPFSGAPLYECLLMTLPPATTDPQGATRLFLA